MPSNVETYVSEVAAKYATRRAGEHAYRPAFEKLISALDPNLKIVNDPKRSEHGAPDFVFVRGELTSGYAETKDVGISLDKTEKSEQMERYLGYSKLILTDYLEFRFFHNGQKYGEPIVIAAIRNGRIVGTRDQYEKLTDTLKDFLNEAPAEIKNGARLAEIMGGKARRIRDNVRQYLAQPSERNRELERIFETIKRLLVHDLSSEHFADMYAQTLVYGLFAARFHDTSKEPFTRQKARDLVPASNPFLRHFFDHIVGPDFDVRLGYIVNELCEVFSHADVHALMGQYFKKNGDIEGPDPVIHFYEDFLREYDPEQRKRIGAFYTPLPVVRFIVRAVDAILERDFGLPTGLADTSKIPIERVRQGRKTKIDVHRVQILDPATGTGTFLNETIRAIARRFQGQEGRWAAYVDNDLLPRVHGFELMMASYTIAHLKLGMTLEESGYKRFDKRLGIYLTNSLERGELPDDTLFGFGLSQSIAEEAREAAVIKRETPIMVVLGNPPYSGVSSNETTYANSLVEKYKVEPGGKQKLNERKHWLNDDYVKFLALAENFVDKNGEGVVGFITNHGYLDNPTFRGMRWQLLRTFSALYIVDLHGNVKEQHSQRHAKDENVFSIQQGVAILIAVKKRKNNIELGTIQFSELWGERSEKFGFLDRNNIDSIAWRSVQPREPYYFFKAPQIEQAAENEYQKGFSVSELFKEWSMGFATARDNVTIQFSRNDVEQLVTTFSEEPEDGLRLRYNLGKDSRDWRVSTAKKDARSSKNEDIRTINYRPFDDRWTLYTGNSKGFYASPQIGINQHLLGNNIALNFIKRDRDERLKTFISTKPTDKSFLSTKDNSYVFPLYLYASDGSKISNFKKEIVANLEKAVGKTRSEDILDYIYAIMYSPSYSDTNKEFLKIDFPRVPYPSDKSQFERLAALGRELRALHLLASPKVGHLVTTYAVGGSNVVEKIEYKDSRVYINGEQYVGNVPAVAWNCYIGGYQPAQKWLKDRKGRALTNADIEHYQTMIVALLETDRITHEIDAVLK